MNEIQLEENCRLLFLGDFLYDYDQFGSDIVNIGSWITKNKFSTILNLESPLLESSSPIIKRGPNLFQGKVSIDILKSLNVICVCLANNHIFDYGYPAFEDTIELLKENGIRYIGAGKDLESASIPLFMYLPNGKQIVLANYGWEVEEAVPATKNSFGCNPRSDEWVVGCTTQIKDKYPNAFLINIFHWGFEFNLYPMPYDISLAHRSIDSGCDLIIGHHPHCIQAKETYKNRVVYYSLGNFYFGSLRDSFGQVNGKGHSICDLGLMIILDSENFFMQEKFILYDRRIEHSIIYNDYGQIEDITDIDYCSESYRLLASKNAFKVNPILSANRITANKQLKRLMNQYKIAGMLQVLKKTSLGTSIYALLRRVAKKFIE